MIIKSTSQKSTAIKICGITNVSQAISIAKLRINAIGIIGVKNSPRFVPIEKSKKIFNEIEKISSNIHRVYVIANKNIGNIDPKFINNNVIQLHGNESVEYCKQLKNEYPKVKLWKAFRLKSKNDLEKISLYQDDVDALLIDAWDDISLGGTGKRVSLELLININFKIPWILAGGISAEIIPEIFSKIMPDGVDASSRLERTPGIKDLGKVESLIRAIRKIN